MTTLLILGGTSEAASLALALSSDEQLHVITSLAGRTTEPRSLPGEIRVGGFGGVEGLSQFLKERAIDLVIDATHPFAKQMSWHAHLACRDLAVPRLLLTRPQWKRCDGDRWHEVPDINSAAICVGNFGRNVFLTSGQRDLEAFADLDDLWFLIRTVEPIKGKVPKQIFWLQARGPFTEASEIELMTKHRIDVLVTKASGGEATYGKIAAARRLRLPVIMIGRPDLPQGPMVDSIGDAQTWLQRQVTG